MRQINGSAAIISALIRDTSAALMRTASGRLPHPLAFLKGHSHLLQAAGWHGWATKPETCGPRSKLTTHDPLAPIGLAVPLPEGRQQPTIRRSTTSVSMIVDDQLHTMPMKFSQGLQQAIYRGAEVVQGLDHDGIDLVPGNGTKNRSQPWQTVPALRDADNAINLDGDDRPATCEVDQEVIGPGSTAIRVQV